MAAKYSDNDMWQVLVDSGVSFGIPMEDLLSSVSRFQAYYELLLKWQSVVRLTAIIALDDVVVKHFVDSLAVYPYISEGALADVGSGAGFPGGPLGLVKDGLRVTFVEKDSRKCRFLEVIQSRLHIQGEVIQARSDEYARQVGLSFPVVVARALAAPAAAISMCSPLLGATGKMVLQAGPSILQYQDELKRASEVNACMLYDVVHYQLPLDKGSRVILLFEQKRII